ncbi:antibiotic biosynthesis monooxygenase [Pseudothauera nasutitermitis]|uniref:Antibiotic biosynthesis monooxygenase n=1 Tax=Pseudothauera nasutitermitis TaxID=2565930 RepID=A0A4S4AQ36_9RHOO|nr:antibiotic biosynthesis monooxygenase [Pseudothauera nasutitermitis]THF61846.1 antibiotic biosynthesis monooxygenase [Pseudothauera nasutitermitis]
MQHGTSTPAPLTRIARRRAIPGREAEYEARVREMFAAMRNRAGFLGADLLPPEQAGGDYQIVVRFASEAALQAWDESPERAHSHARLREVAEGEPEFRRLSGLEAWFAPAVVPATMHPPRARMAVVTWLGIFPTVSLVLWLVAPLLQALPFLLRTALLTALIVAVMTWVVMPRLTRLLHGWLAGRRSG